MNSIGLISNTIHEYVFDVKRGFSFNFYFHIHTRLGISNKLVVIKSFMGEEK